MHNLSESSFQGGALPWSGAWLVPTDQLATEAIVEQLISQLVIREWGARDLFAIRMGLEEAITNAMLHGNCSTREKYVKMIARITADRLEVEIEDEGEGFDPSSVPDPRSDDRLDLPHGRGIFLMNAYMSSVEFMGRGNRVRMVKLRTHVEHSKAASQPSTQML